MLMIMAWQWSDVIYLTIHRRPFSWDSSPPGWQQSIFQPSVRIAMRSRYRPTFPAHFARDKYYHFFNQMCVRRCVMWWWFSQRTSDDDRTREEISRKRKEMMLKTMRKFQDFHYFSLTLQQSFKKNQKS